MAYFPLVKDLWWLPLWMHLIPSSFGFANRNLADILCVKQVPSVIPKVILSWPTGNLLKIKPVWYSNTVEICFRIWYPNPLNIQSTLGTIWSRKILWSENSEMPKYCFWLTGHRNKEQKVETKLRGVASVMTERWGVRGTERGFWWKQCISENWGLLGR